jgi:hypothetical protein
LLLQKNSLVYGSGPKIIIPLCTVPVVAVTTILGFTTWRILTFMAENELYLPSPNLSGAIFIII